MVIEQLISKMQWFYLLYFHACLYTVIKVEHISNYSADEEYVFPDEDDNLTAYVGGYAKLMVPTGLLQNISK